MRFLGLDDVLCIASAVLGAQRHDVERIADMDALHASLVAQGEPRANADSDRAIAARGSALAVELLRRSPLPRANGALAWCCLREFVWRNDRDLTGVDANEAVEMILELQRDPGNDKRFAPWVAERVTGATQDGV